MQNITLSKTFLFTFLLFLLSQNLKSQNTFEKGYFIDISGEKTNCLIKNIDWLYNPSNFDYKLSEAADIKNTTISQVKEFGIYNKSKYIKFKGDVDISSEDVDNLSNSRKPIFKQKVLFLKVLIEGNANLYQYQGKNILRFFYNVNDSKIEQLIFKNYRKDNVIAANKHFKQKLLTTLKCKNLNENTIKNTDYRKSDLIDLFSSYNLCKNPSYKVNEKKSRKNAFNVALKAGFRSSSLDVALNTGVFILKGDYAKKTNFTFGFEAEYIFGFNNKKWAVFIEPTYQSYSSEGTISAENEFTISGGTKVEYTSIELPIGVRHYLFLNDNSKIFLNIAYVSDFVQDKSSNNPKSFIEFENTFDQKIDPVPNLAIGVGYKYNNKFSAELRYGGSRELTNKNIYTITNYRTLSLILGVNIL